MTLNWESISALIILISAVATVNLFATRSIVRQAISDLLKDLHDANSGFVPRETCALLHERTRADLDAVSKYAHESKHFLASELSGLQMIVRSIEKPQKSGEQEA